MYSEEFERLRRAHINLEKMRCYDDLDRSIYDESITQLRREIRSQVPQDYHGFVMSREVGIFDRWAEVIMAERFRDGV